MLHGDAAHILVACAGLAVTTYPSLAATTAAEFDAAFAVNTRGAFLCLREAANRIPHGGGGRIVAVSSTLAATLLPGYAASKAAVEAMAKELKRTRVTANCVAPGPVATELFFAGKSEEMIERFKAGNPMGRLGEVGDIAPVVGFLCTDAAEWVNGQVIRVNGGIA
uniref:NAD-dependent epimerase/dehydratase domain-containing protein n=1 Tax=Leersia perrieri TaxID=77586 RepID=A0A0D9WVY8_9ORYZ